MTRYFISSITVWYLVISTVSSQEVKAFTGDSVVLPCLYNSDEPQKDFTIFWRTSGDRNVYDILDSHVDLSNQNQQFRDRTSAFPEEYVKGNFSILLKNAVVSDSGHYECFIPKFNILRRVDLVVRDKPVQPKEDTVENTEENTRGGGASLRENLSLLTLVLIGHAAHCH